VAGAKAYMLLRPFANVHAHDPRRRGGGEHDPGSFFSGDVQLNLVTGAQPWTDGDELHDETAVGQLERADESSRRAEV
jgi:hypothetical protein